MLTEVIQSIRSVRGRLVLGFSVVVSIWLLAGSTSRTVGTTALGVRLHNAFLALGSATQLAVATLAAALIGSLIWNLGFHRIVETIHGSMINDWDAYIDEARQEVRMYEEHYPGLSEDDKRWRSRGDQENRIRIPSLHWAQYLHETVDERVSQSEEVKFRIVLSFASIPPLVIVAIQGSGWWRLAPLVIIAIVADLLLMSHPIQAATFNSRISLLEKQIEAINAEIEAEETNLEKALKKSPTSDHAEIEASIESLKGELGTLLLQQDYFKGRVATRRFRTLGTVTGSRWRTQSSRES